VEILEVTEAIRAARAQWQWRGTRRPAFAEPTGPGEESVWDFPRPPRLEEVSAALEVSVDERVLALTHRGLRVCETAGAPTYYFPIDDVAVDQLEPSGNLSLCEWKGIAQELQTCGGQNTIGWRYTQTFPEFDRIRGWYAFYPARVLCRIDKALVRAQPGGYYGGWVHDCLRGPIKGEPGSEAW
jgi:uncharacterized protein (DUF427 family)